MAWRLTLVSPDGDMGFPGTLTAHVRYTVVGKSLKINYSATTTKPTVVNLTNHSYFNLGGRWEGHDSRHGVDDSRGPLHAGGCDADSYWASWRRWRERRLISASRRRLARAFNDTMSS
jgi:hypothetical protein